MQPCTWLNCGEMIGRSTLQLLDVVSVPLLARLRSAQHTGWPIGSYGLPESSSKNLLFLLAVPAYYSCKEKTVYAHTYILKK